MEQLESLKSQLAAGENLLWTGRPEGFEAMDAEYKPGYIKKCIITLLCSVALAVFYVVYAMNSGVGVKWGFIVIIAAIAAYILASPFSDVKKLKNSYLYAVTDKRVMIMTDKVKSAEYSQLSNVSVRKDAAGKVSFLFGEAAKTQKASEFRTLAVTCINKENDDFPKNIVFYGIKDHEGLKKVLKNYIPLS